MPRLWLAIRVLRLGCGEARIDILRSSLMLRTFPLFQARQICLLQGLILIEGTTNEIRTIG
jgi:hypothetical protein